MSGRPLSRHQFWPLDGRSSYFEAHGDDGSMFQVVVDGELHCLHERRVLVYLAMI
jgi:hypothetical protein